MGKVIVIDPGHGGENEGTKEHLAGSIEKEMTLETSRALRDTLREYEDVEVYMTREEDVELSLNQRAEYAKSVNADFIFSIHYNASADHDLYGAEVWIPSDRPYLEAGLDFAIPMLHCFEKEGLFIRGAKTRLNDKGANYYGIIRESTKLGIPCVIIEHCHVDHEKDVGYCDSSDDLRHFGELDARCIAGYLGLTGKDKGPESENEAEDRFFSGDESTVFNTWNDPVRCDIELVGEDEGGATILVSAEDADSLLLYYDYSLDGGNTFSQRVEMPGYDYFGQKYDKEFSCHLDIDREKASDIVFRVYNTFDGEKESNHIILDGIPRPEEEEAESEPEPEMTVIPKASPRDFDVNKDMGVIVLWVLLITALSLTLFLIILLTKKR